MDDSLSVKEILEATGGRLLQGEPSRRIGSFSTDSRTLKPGDLFIALKGKTFDGHAFILQALERGAVGVVLSEPSKVPSSPFALSIQVEDTVTALGEIARAWRERHPIPLVAVTGSNGKTTTKEMLRSILAQKGSVLASPLSFNNLIGVPLTLLNLRSHHETAVLELGMNARGEIRRLAEISRPDVGVITNIGEAHLEFLGSLEGVAEAKGELLPSLDGDRVAVLNLDDPLCNALFPRVRGRLLTFGINPRADVWASDLVSRDEGAIAFTLHRGGEQIRVELPLIGRHNVYNALAAACAASALGVDLQRIAFGLHKMTQAPMRLEKRRLSSGAVVINDAYNANPTSMQASLEAFFEVKAGRAILVLGDMLELGERAGEAHRRIGELVARLSPDLLITVGEGGRIIGEGALAAGFPRDRVHPFGGPDQARSFLQEHLSEETWVFLKASRGMHLEKVLEGL